MRWHERSVEHGIQLLHVHWSRRFEARSHWVDFDRSRDACEMSARPQAKRCSVETNAREVILHVSNDERSLHPDPLVMLDAWRQSFVSLLRGSLGLANQGSDTRSR